MFFHLTHRYPHFFAGDQRTASPELPTGGFPPENRVAVPALPAPEAEGVWFSCGFQPYVVLGTFKGEDRKEANHFGGVPLC